MPDLTSRHPVGADSTPNGNGTLDPLLEAEAIRTLLGEAQSRLSRLASALKQFRKQSRAVAAAVQSLRELPPLAP